MTHYLRPIYRGIVRSIPYRVKHQIKLALIPSWRKLENRWINRPNAIPIHKPQIPTLPEYYVSTYPRSGTTWLLFMIADVLAQLSGYVTDTESPEVINILKWVDQTGDFPYSMNISIHPIKSHKIQDIEQENVIYLFRQPADVLTSYYHFHFREEGLRPIVETRTIDEFVLEYAQEWREHVEKAIQMHERNKHILLISYEQMIENPQAALKTVIDFANLPASEDMIRRAVENRTFDKLKSLERQAAKDSPNTDCYIPFFRKGKVGSSHEELKPETLKALDEKTLGTFQRAFALTALAADSSALLNMKSK
jgi:hypothetical protein